MIYIERRYVWTASSSMSGGGAHNAVRTKGAAWNE